MKKLNLAVFAIFAFSFSVSMASGVNAVRGKAQHSPESILTCTDFTQHGAFSVLSTSVPFEINADQCRTYDETQPPDLCAACIGSLESQRCKIIDVDVVQVDDNVAQTLGHTKVTYLMSCNKP
jgi:hypothetical protein